MTFKKKNNKFSETIYNGNKDSINRVISHFPSNLIFSVFFVLGYFFQEGVVLRSLQIEKTKGREIDWTRFFFVFIIIHARTLIYTRPQKTFFVVNHRG